MKRFLLLPILCLVGCGVAPVVDSLSQLDHLGPVPAYSFRAHDGSQATEKDLSGRVTVLDFFFTSCTGVCPTMKSNMERVRRAFLSDTTVQCLSITVDPDRDTVEKLTEFWKTHGSLDGWRFATGEKAAIFKLAREGLHLGTSEVPGDILHSDRFILIDKKGEVRGYYHGTDRADVDRLISDARSLLKAE